jgi:hypothetical protein
MDSREVRKLVEDQIGNDWAVTNGQNVDLRRALIVPRQITVIDRQVKNGRVKDRLVSVWLVLLERRKDNLEGYRIVMREDEPVFGLASVGYPEDEHLILCGWYGDFLTALQGM